MSVLAKRLFQLLLIGFFSLSSAVAEEKKGVTQGTYEALQEINKLLDSDKNKQAIRKLETLSAEVKDNAYEYAIVQQQLAYSYLNVDNYSKAYRAGEKALATNELPKKAFHSMNWMMAQLAFQESNYKGALKYTKRWLDQEPETKEKGKGEFLMGRTHYRLKKYSTAAKYIEAAMKRTRTPSMDMHKVLLAVYMEGKKYSKAEKLLIKMVNREPKQELWWQYLIGVYLEQNKEQKALSALVVADKYYNLEFKDVKRMMQLYDYVGLPYKAAQTMQKSLDGKQQKTNYKNLRRLAQYWLNSREYSKAIEILTDSAKLAKNGKDHLLIAHLYMEKLEWDKAVKSLQIALRKGGLKKYSKTQYLLGIAAYNSKQNDIAKKAFEKAAKSPSYEKKVGYWLTKISEKEAQQNQKTIAESQESTQLSKL